jgi:hypothetical protein
MPVLVADGLRGRDAREVTIAGTASGWAGGTTS